MNLTFSVMIVIIGKRFFLHRLVLSSRSKYFEILFRNHLSINGSAEDISVEIEGFSTDVLMQNAFELLMKNIYYEDSTVWTCTLDLKFTFTALVVSCKSRDYKRCLTRLRIRECVMRMLMG